MTYLRHFGGEMGDDTTYFTGSSGLVITAANVRTGLRAIQVQSAGGLYFDFSGTEEDDEMVVGLAIRTNSPASNDPSVTFRGDGGTIQHVTVAWEDSTRRVRVFRGAYGGTLLGESDPNTWDFAQYDYWEIKVLVADGVGGSVTIRKNGQAFLTIAGVDTRNGGVDALIDRIGFDRLNAADQFNMDDGYILNTQGVAPHNDFLGDSAIYPLTATAAGFYTNLTPIGSATNWQNVDKTHTLDDANYNEDSIVADEDTYGFGDLTIPAGVIHGVLLHIRAGKSDAGAKQGRRVYRRAAVDDFGADLAIPVGFGNFFEMLALDPIAAAAWTIANVNASEFGFEVRT